ncbi:MAG TPA: TMEM175 family protein [Kamptonema sp.]|nr:TMEM175 family protein [Kamptonema sp.]
MDRLEEKETGRIEAFSDGVFAIAITLLVLEIKVPHHNTVETSGLVSALLSLWPSYLAFLTSFATILVMWVNHHRIFSLVRRSDHLFFYWNGLLLLFVTFIPFPTAVLAEYLTHPEAKIAATVYAGTFLAIALAFQGLWRHVSRGGRLLAQGAKREDIDGITKQFRFGPPLYLTAFILSFISVWLSVGLCIFLAVFFAFPGLSSNQ